MVLNFIEISNIEFSIQIIYKKSLSLFFPTINFDPKGN
ncbi:hypothetical protein LEP1GSC008_4609 [Leptospira kirschneri serovar Bulgarica str. Nikolaevo]|uniref:Uncharacterized protein n=1 Tax=Leptospira kirschneri serovar Bulgarica str. Nikolaevo TaxID=1240687 RepID=M6FC58_9LEPT|nr:hypothetical protein LEP1GSC008_4609 [Leptospira kirschneri serovar Bulgarica str. Nikolaevo]